MDTCELFDKINIGALLDGSAKRLLPEARDPALFTRHAKALDAVEARARAALATPIPQLPWSLFRLFRDTGNRYLYEAPYFERRRRLADLQVCLLAGRDTDGSLLAAFQDMIWAICEEYTWSLPAHLWDCDIARHESIQLDLFASETGFYLAEIVHNLGDRLDPRIVTRIRECIRERIIESYLAHYPKLGWESGPNNWGAVCAGSIGSVFLYEEHDPIRLETAFRRLFATMRGYLSTFPEDGACEEGVEYWAYGFGYYVIFAELLSEYTGGAINLLDDPKIHAIARFPQRVQLSTTRTVSFSDGGRFYNPQHCILERLNRRFPDVVPPGGPIKDAQNARPGHLVREFAWCDPSRPATPPPDAAEFFPGNEWLVVRKAPFAFAALFGNNGVSHNHNDVGAFLLIDGDREGPMDLGRGEYTRQYFGEQRYGLRFCGSHGHSVPIVGGQFQKQGCEHKASDVRFGKAADGSVSFSGDIAGTYAIEGLASLRREFTVRADAREATVTDDFVFDGAPLSVTERFIGFEKPEVLAPGKARFGAFEVEFDPALEARVVVLTGDSYGTLENRSTKKVEAFALDIALPQASSFSIVFRAC